MRSKMVVLLVLATGLGLTAGPAVAVTANTVRVSVSSTGVQADSSSSTAGQSANSGVSRTGRFIVFQSGATNLVANDTNGLTDIFIYDRSSGKTRRVSVSSSGTEADGNSSSPSVSADGRYVAFTSSATNLVAGDSNGVSDVFVRDRSTGKTRRVSISSSGAQGDGNSSNASISADGAHVVFGSDATNLVGADTNAVRDVFVRDRSTGKTRRVSVSSSGAQSNGGSDLPSISGDGKVVEFFSSATNLVSGDSNGALDVFVRFRSTGKTRRVSVSSSGAQANGSSDWAAISTDGRVVAFVSTATNLVGSDTNGARDAFVRILATGKTRRVSISSAGAEANGGSDQPAISASGRYVTFLSGATNLIGSDANGFTDVFLRDISANKTRRVSVRFDGTEGNGSSTGGEISGDGRFVAFVSGATNLVGGDTNGFSDVFLRGPLH